MGLFAEWYLKHHAKDGKILVGAVEGAVGPSAFTEYYLQHHGVNGQKWGVRRYQNADGSLTAAGRAHQRELYYDGLNRDGSVGSSGGGGRGGSGGGGSDEDEDEEESTEKNFLDKYADMEDKINKLLEDGDIKKAVNTASKALNDMRKNGAADDKALNIRIKELQAVYNKAYKTMEDTLTSYVSRASEVNGGKANTMAEVLAVYEADRKVQKSKEKAAKKKKK